jgi:hypothetical protein
VNLVLAGAAILMVAALGWVVVPAARASTYTLMGAVLMTIGVIAVNTFRNANPSRSMGRLLHDPDRRRD